MEIVTEFSKSLLRYLYCIARRLTILQAQRYVQIIYYAVVAILFKPPHSARNKIENNRCVTLLKYTVTFRI